ncbi:MAG: abortive phage infection protein [Holdemanella biformis]|nr:abortive phage infection protein [Holdemanella biformis]
MADNYELLRSKDIISILDGDVTIEEKENYTVKMPYLSGPKLVEICNIFGLSRKYGSESRWVYLDELLEYVIANNRCDELLRYLFDRDKFRDLLKLKTPEDISNAYEYTLQGVINRINVALYLERHELQCIQGHYYIVEVGKNPVIEATNIKFINLSYVQGLRERCTEDFISGNYDSVITKSRTVIEEVLIFILESNKIPVESKGDLNRIYNQVKGLYNMRQDKGYDGRVNSLLSGLEKIVQSVGEMRNINSDSHGVGRNRIAIKESEARLVMNSAVTFSEYILDIYKNHK